jgi:ankyrin repeat protein
MAAYGGHVDICKLLVENGADINIKNEVSKIGNAAYYHTVR